VVGQGLRRIALVPQRPPDCRLDLLNGVAITGCCAHGFLPSCTILNTSLYKWGTSGPIHRSQEGRGNHGSYRHLYQGMWSVVAKAKMTRPFNVELFLSTVDGGRILSNYGKDQRVFSQGDPADSVFYIQESKVKIAVLSDRGKEAVVALHGKGDFFGEGCLTGQPLRLATAATMTDSVIMRLDKAAMVRVLHNEPKFSEVFMAFLLARNARVEADLVDQLFNSSEKRLARVLLLMANFGKEGRTEPVVAKISQETLAEMVGTTRSRVSVFMNKFRKLGFIEYNGDLRVHNSLLDVVLHDNPHLRSRED
jgi:CRP/FNR family transcriptional regulator, cyclic AMP receptor protein